MSVSVVYLWFRPVLSFALTLKYSYSISKTCPFFILYERDIKCDKKNTRNFVKKLGSWFFDFSQKKKKKDIKKITYFVLSRPYKAGHGHMRQKKHVFFLSFCYVVFRIIRALFYFYCMQQTNELIFFILYKNTDRV